MDCGQPRVQPGLEAVEDEGLRPDAVRSLRVVWTFLVFQDVEVAEEAFLVGIGEGSRDLDEVLCRDADLDLQWCAHGDAFRVGEDRQRNRTTFHGLQGRGGDRLPRREYRLQVVR